MARFWKCPNGHSWDAFGDSASSVAVETVCPVCGALPVSTGVVVSEDAETVSPADVALMEETLVPPPSTHKEGFGGPLPPSAGRCSGTEWDPQAHEETLVPPPPAEEDETLVPAPPVARAAPAADAPAPSFDETLERPSGPVLPPPPPGSPEHFDETLSRPALPPRTGGRKGGAAPTDGSPDGNLSSNDTLQRPAAPRAPSTARATVAGYEVLGVLGRGGMGVVYKARQKGLDRLVALKMILAGGHAGQQDLERFRIEAQAVAQLQHPNIVQVYEVGERDGHPFFSLEYLEGGSLQQKLDGTPLPPRQVAQTLETLAQAMDYAHQKGIIHRDLKPANVLLTADGTPKIADFGLAKRLEQDAGQTGSEAILGTPAYMAPEQAAGKARFVGPAADIYSLGAILYDLLTGRPPFRGTSVIETLQMVQSAEPIPPVHLQPTIPRDLQTICLKCLEKEPARRYARAADLAEDLRRFQEGRPILARPTPAWERAWKWARRRPALAALYATLVLGTLAVLAIILIYTTQLQQKNRDIENQNTQINAKNNLLEQKQTELKDKNERLIRTTEAEKTARKHAEDEQKKAEEEKRRAQEAERKTQASFNQVQQAVENLTQASQKVLRNLPRSEAQRRELLERALKMSQFFLAEKGASAPAVLRTARAHRMVGDLCEQLGRYDEARDRYRASADQFQKLIIQAKQNDPAKADGFRKELVEVLMNAWSVAENKHPREAEALLAELSRLLTAPPLDPAQRERFQWCRAAVLNNQGIHAQKHNDLDGARKAYQEAEKLLASLPDKPPYQLERARVETNQGALWTGEAAAKTGAADAGQRARKAYEQALRRLEPLVKDHPNEPVYARELGRTYANLGVLLKNSHQPYEPVYAKAVAVFEGLAQRSPEVPDYRHLIATSHAGWGQHLLQDRHLPYALEHLRTARSMLEQLVRDFTDVAVYREDLARCCNGLGITLTASKNPSEGQEPLERALSLLDGLRRDNPENTEQEHDREAVLGNLISLHESEARRLGSIHSWAKAEEHVRRLLDLLKMQAGAKPSPAARGKQANALLTLAQLYLAQGQHEKADAALVRVFTTAPPQWKKASKAVRILGNCLLAVEQDRRLATARRRQLIRQYGRQALEQLRVVAKQGGKEAAALFAAPELEALRARTEFKTQFDALRVSLGSRPNRP